MRHLSIFLFCIFHFSHVAIAQNKLPIEAFAAPASFSEASLSPNGAKIGFLTDKDGEQVLIALDLKTKESVLIPKFGDAMLYDFFWANEDVVVLEYILSHDKNTSKATRETRVVSYDLSSGKFNWLGGPKRKTGMSNQERSRFARVIHYLPDEPDHILMELDEIVLQNNRGALRINVAKVNVRNGHTNEIKPGRRGIKYWYTDFEGNIRLAFGDQNFTGSQTDNKRVFVYVEDDGSLTDLTKTSWYKAEDDWFEVYNIEGLSNQKGVLYISALSEYGTKGIYTMNILTGEIISTVFEHEKLDVDGILNDPDTGNMSGVYYTDDITEWVYFDSKYKKIQKSLKKALGVSTIAIAGKARDTDKYLIVAYSPTNPGEYYLYDRTNKSLDYIAPKHADIYPEDMGSVTRVTYEARDGTPIPAYLTLPKGESKNLPTVILPHGGPHARDAMNWDYWAQFYANRGYAVIQPNFRGSTGYGDTYYKAGRHQWGGLMQDDVTDATHWMIKEGYSDPERICILGGSYGGYASLFGPIKEPDLYKCAVSINGVADLKEMRRQDTRDFSEDDWIQYIGLKGHDPEYTSPYYRAEELNVPVLLIAATTDARVPYQQSTAMHKKLKKLGKDSTYIEMDDGDHWLGTKKARMITLSATEKFLAEHIGN